MSRTYDKRGFVQRRRQVKGYSGTSVVFILLCCVLTVILLSTSYLGDRLVNSYVTPVFAKIMGKSATPEPEAISEPVLAQEQELVPNISPNIERLTLELPGTSWYLLQMGAYADPEEAHTQALSIQSMGAGGYIYEDEQGFNRVFAAAYADQESILRVQLQVRNSGHENTAYSIHLDGIQITLSGQGFDVERLKAAVQTIQDVPNSLTDFSLKYDEKGFTPAQAILFLNDLSVLLSSAHQTFEGLKESDSITKMDEYAIWIMDSISTFLSKSDMMNTIECGAAMKHLQIESILKYNILIKDIE